METGQEYIGNPDPHVNFAEILRNKVYTGKIGQWTKVKWRLNK